MDRRKAMRELTDCGVKLDRAGMVIGPGGNISARVGDVVYIKASGTSMGDGREEDYVGLSLSTGEAVEGKLKPSCEFKMHLEAFKAREDVSAFIHSHPPYATAWAASGKALRAPTPDFAAFLGDEVPVLPYTAPASEELARSVAEALRERDAAILTSHGMVAVGGSLREAFAKTLLVDDAAKMVLAALAAGLKPAYLGGEEARRIHNWEVEAFRRRMLKG